jgi:hydroxylamine reductase (hybrid-cluster protein)
VLLLVNESSSDESSLDTDDNNFLSDTDDNKRLQKQIAKEMKKAASEEVSDPHMILRSAAKARRHLKEKHDLSDTDSEDEDGA